MSNRPAGHRDGEGLTARGESAACELCRREVDRYTVHHLTPKARGGRFGPTARLCPTCHRRLHALFSETTLANDLHTLDLLRANPQVDSFLKWMRQQLPLPGFAASAIVSRLRLATIEQICGLICREESDGT